MAEWSIATVLKLLWLAPPLHRPLHTISSIVSQLFSQNWGIFMDVMQAVDEYLAAKEGPTTIRTQMFHKQSLLPFARWCAEQNTGLEQIRLTTIQKYFKEFAEDKAPNTVHNCMQSVKTFLNWCAVDDDYKVSKVMVSRIELPKVEQPDVEIFTTTELKKLFAACKKTAFPERNLAMVYLLLDTGARVSEVFWDDRRPQEQTGLLLENVFLEPPNDAHIRIMGKGRKMREVGIGKTTRLALQRYIKYHRGRSPSPYLFLRGRHGADMPLTINGAAGVLEGIGEIAMVEHVHPHKFRHTFAVNFLLNGGDSLVLMRIMGHSSLYATNIYTRAVNSQLARKTRSVLDGLH